MLFPMRSVFFLKHSMLSHIVVLQGQRKNVFLLVTGQLNAGFCYLGKWVGHPATEMGILPGLGVQVSVTEENMMVEQGLGKIIES